MLTSSSMPSSRWKPTLTVYAAFSIARLGPDAGRTCPHRVPYVDVTHASGDLPPIAGWRAASRSAAATVGGPPEGREIAEAARVAQHAP